MRILIEKIKVPANRQRKTHTKEGIDSLAASMAKQQINPITVTVRESDGTCSLIAGERRLLAAKQLGWVDIEANEFGDLSPLEREEIELDENLQRENLPWQEEVAAKKRIWEIRAELYGETVEQAAEHVGISRGSLWEDARLAKVIEDVPELGKSKNKTQAMNKLRLLQRRMGLEELARRQAVVPTGHDDYSGRVILGNCVEVLQTRFKANETISLVLTDPPYGMDLDVGETKKGSAHPEIYADDHYDIMEVVELAAREAYRLLKADSHAYFWFDIKAYSTIFKFLTDIGFSVDPVPLIWAKNIPGQVNHPSSRWASGYETCFFCRKGDRALLKQGASNVLNYDVVPSGKKIHPTEKPTALLRQLIEASTVAGEIVLDMFGGSGSTAEAALQLGRNFIIIEKDVGYHAGILDRLSKLSPPTSNEALIEGADREGESVSGEDEDEESDIEEAFARNRGT
jgi:ParB/RepB/Spo0J family partition protein